jgi:hypothetical protein
VVADEALDGRLDLAEVVGVVALRAGGEVERRAEDVIP